MEDQRGVETAEAIANDASSVQASIQGALKSQSSNAEKVKRASAVRFADQVNNAEEDIARLKDSMTEEDIIRQSNQESMLSSNASGAERDNKQPVAKVKGRQLVGSVEIEDGDLAATPDDDASDDGRAAAD